MHEGQLVVAIDTVCGLVDRQFPHWSGLALSEVASAGTVNALFRLGDDLTLRLPLQLDHVDLARARLERESAAAHELYGRLPFPTPLPIAIGDPGPGYPLPWSVQSWVPGATAVDVDPSGSDEFADDLARLIVALRTIPTDGRVFDGDGRGGNLRAHDDWVDECLRRSEGLVDVTTLRGVWRELRDTPRIAPDVMSHGDLTPGNVLVDDGRLSGVIDVGGFGPADPALDLVGAWHLLDADRRRIVRDTLDCDDVEWRRGTAWALQQALGAVWYYRTTNRAMHDMGRITLTRILEAHGATSEQR